jgi:hypothetical protein
MPDLVFQDWMLPLTMQQQSVLVLACRGPDGVGKYHPTKEIVCRYRASVLKAAYLGRPMRIDEGDDTTFMTLTHFSDDTFWQAIVGGFFDNVDEIPHHYYMHLAHGAEIVGFKHPMPLMRSRWLSFYHRCADNLHMAPETEADLDARLADWNRQFWDQTENAA